MMDSRRHFLKLTGVATVHGAVGKVLLAAEEPALA